MKFNDVKANFSKIEFHKPTKNITGFGIQMKGLAEGKVNIQIAKQKTERTQTQQPTYCWNDVDKNTSIILSADEIREVMHLIKLTLSGRVVLFDNEKHNKFAERPEFDCVKKYHSSGNSGKWIMFLPKKYRDELQLELSISYKKNNNNFAFQFSFNKQEMEKISMLFYFHQSYEMPKPEGFMSVVLDKQKEVLRQDYMPQLNKGDFITLSNGSYLIEGKTYVSKKNILVYSVTPLKKA